MRMLTAAAGAAVLILLAAPADAGDRRGGGGHQPQPPAPCCHGGGGGGPRPPAPPHGGGWNSNINVNVNASARAEAYASAGARGYLNARTYDVGGARGYVGGGSVYVGGGYGGDAGGYYGGPAVYDDRVLDGPACPSAPFGYVVTGFGRDDFRASRCGYRYDDAGYDRGGRYGYSERHDRYEGRAESRYEVRERYSEYGAYEEGYIREDDRRYEDRRDCGCDRDREAAPYPPAYLPEPPRYAPPHHVAPPPPPRRSPPPRQEYRQEPGERG